MRIQSTPKATVVYFDDPMLCLSSAVFNGGIRQIQNVINFTLTSERPDFKEMPDFCSRICGRYDCNPKLTTILLTTVPQQYGGWSEKGSCFITAGLSTATPLFPEKVWDESQARGLVPGTINSISIVPKALSENALIEAYGLVKMAIAQGIITWSRLHGKNDCVGTPTDRSVVVCPLSDSPLHFAGLQTKVGVEIAKEVASALAKALIHKYPLCSEVKKEKPVQ